ncbi:hypothetical protein Hanom_Chr07g00628001 [Helianthus anomalus]
MLTPLRKQSYTQNKIIIIKKTEETNGVAVHWQKQSLENTWDGKCKVLGLSPQTSAD